MVTIGGRFLNSNLQPRRIVGSRLHINVLKVEAIVAERSDIVRRPNAYETAEVQFSNGAQLMRVFFQVLRAMVVPLARRPGGSEIPPVFPDVLGNHKFIEPRPRCISHVGDIDSARISRASIPSSSTRVARQSFSL